jgi:hypothetical protein
MRREKLNPGGGVSPLERERKTSKRTTEEISGTDLQAEKGIPSGPGAVFLVEAIKFKSKSTEGGIRINPFRKIAYPFLARRRR